jgi:hypothetical protein
MTGVSHQCLLCCVVNSHSHLQRAHDQPHSEKGATAQRGVEEHSLGQREIRVQVCVVSKHQPSLVIWLLPWKEVSRSCDRQGVFGNGCFPLPLLSGAGTWKWEKKKVELCTFLWNKYPGQLPASLFTSVLYTLPCLGHFVLYSHRVSHRERFPRMKEAKDRTRNSGLYFDIFTLTCANKLLPGEWSL